MAIIMRSILWCWVVCAAVSMQVSLGDLNPNATEIAASQTKFETSFQFSSYPSMQSSDLGTSSSPSQGVFSASMSRAADPQCTRFGYIRVVDATTMAQLGYVSATLNMFGEYGLTTDIIQALRVSFTTSSSPSDIVQLNSNPSLYQFIGGVVGFSSTSNNIGPGSFNYLYVAQTAQTTPGSPPSAVGNSFTDSTGIPENSESAIWFFNSASNQITAQWVNSDLSTPATYIMYVPSETTFVLTGDVAAFTATFGGSQVLFYLVETADSGSCPCPRNGAQRCLASGIRQVCTNRIWRTAPPNRSCPQPSA